MRFLLLATLLSFSLVESAKAEPSSDLRFAHLFSNDYFGDGQDRWHSGSLSLSVLKVDDLWNGESIGSTGKAIEFRFRSEIVAPSNLATPSPNDRPYAGILSFGVHRHVQAGPYEASVGMDLVFVGPQTGLLTFQRKFHRAFNKGNFGSVRQLANAIHPTASGEVAKSFQLSDFARARPFLEAQAGVETFIRTGIDFEFGHECVGQYKVREVTTGQRYADHNCRNRKSSLATLGIDFAGVLDSHLLPSSSGLDFARSRVRVRLGVQQEGRYGSIFYGLTWLGKEYEGQRSGQVVGSIGINLVF